MNEPSTLRQKVQVFWLQNIMSLKHTVFWNLYLRRIKICMRLSLPHNYTIQIILVYFQKKKKLLPGGGTFIITSALPVHVDFAWMLLKHIFGSSSNLCY